MLAHNGEINTLRGNVNWMKSHETRHGARRLRRPQSRTSSRSSSPARSDTAALDNVFELLVRGRSQRCRWSRPMLIPEASASNRNDAGQSTATMYGYCNCVMEPWDGPAAHRRHRPALGRGRPGPQRPAADALRRAPRDGLLIVGSETGMVPLDEHDDRREGPRSARARCIAVDMATGTLLPRPRAQGHAGRPQALRRLDRRTSPTSTS